MPGAKLGADLLQALKQNRENSAALSPSDTSIAPGSLFGYVGQGHAMNTSSQEFEDAAAAAGALRPESQLRQRELDECRRRIGELERAEALLAGENRLLKMVASGRPLTELLTVLCRLMAGLYRGRM